MKKICAWCGKDMGSTSLADDQPDLITHSICEMCSRNIFSQMGRDLTQFLDGLGEPVLVIG
ncbi:MAG: hypothetical protein JRF25_13865 [Deltaproteobacteria bacterium]|nr:hypothetical protein [Deltaproteobacteria bacterium]